MVEIQIEIKHKTMPGKDRKAVKHKSPQELGVVINHQEEVKNINICYLYGTVKTLGPLLKHRH